MASTSVLRGLKCSLCLNLLKEPKQLSCTDSFCEKCLQQFHLSQGTPEKLKCPVCHRITRLGTKGLSELNVPLKSTIGDVKTSIKQCTLCDPEAKSTAVHYCQQCDEYMCESCIQAHENLRKNASHVLVSMDDIKSGKLKVKQKLMCQEHAGEEKLFVCTSCKVFICSRCRIVDHNGSDHKVLKVDEYKKNTMDEIESLKKKGLEKMEKIKSFTKVIREQVERVEVIMAEKEADINKAFDETLLQLNAKKNTLLDQSKDKELKLKEELFKYGKEGNDLITSISSACELVGNGVRALLDGEALKVHNNLCKELLDMLDRDDPDESNPIHVTSRAEAMSFTPCGLDDEHILGMLTIKAWKLEKVAQFPISGILPDSMAHTKKGQMFVGYIAGGIEEFTVSGPQKSVLKDIGISCMSVLSDGRFVVRDVDRNISLYSIDWNKLHTKHFDGERYDHSSDMSDMVMFGAMDVDKYDNIYVNSNNNKAIRVFKPEGLEPIREIPCDGFSPKRICTMNHSNMLVVGDRYSVRVIDQQGTVKHDVKQEFSFYALRPAVLSDDSILIGWMKDGLVSIDLYTNQLRHVRTVISDLMCSQLWVLREFSSGEIAFCHGFISGSTFSVLRKA